MSIFSSIFKKKPPATTHVELLTGQPAIFTPFSGNAYANDIYRAAVDAIARNGAKLKGTHVIKTLDGRRSGDSSLDRLLQVRPNPIMSAYDALYKMITHYFLFNNAFAFLQKDTRGEILGIYPFRPASVEFMTDPTSALYGKFLFNDGKAYTLPYADVIHLRRHYNDNDILGDANTALIPALELAHTQNEGIIQGIKTGAHLRGILKFIVPLSDENLKAAKERFMNDYMQMDNNGGVIATDTRGEYVPLKQEPYVIDEQQIQAAKQKIYAYLGISEKIVESTYNEDEWAAFYESVIEPIAVQLSLEFTSKIFTGREQAFGNEILFESNRLQFASAKTKAALIKEVMPLGLLTINQALEILNMPGVPDGDKRIVSLNYINKAIADQYQLGDETP